MRRPNIEGFTPTLIPGEGLSDADYTRIAASDPYSEAGVKDVVNSMPTAGEFSEGRCTRVESLAEDPDFLRAIASSVIAESMDGNFGLLFDRPVVIEVQAPFTPTTPYYDPDSFFEPQL